MEKRVLITKEDGTQEYFDPAKLESSLRKAGASEAAVEDVASRVLAELTEGMSTSKIYRRAFSLLRRRERPAAARYSVKRAVLALGPSGYPFEDYLAEVFRARGFSAKTRIVLKGACVEHELDLLAEGRGKRIGGEVKFHNSLGLKSDVKVALYVAARFEDLAGAGDAGRFDERWLVTNTKFTEQAVLYGKCAGLSLVSWDYPRRGNLHEIIAEAGVAPVTCLTTLSAAQKNRLLAEHIVLCRDLVRHRGVLASLGLSGREQDEVLAEAGVLCGSS